MSLDQIAFILENCHTARIEYIPYGKLVKFRLHEGDDWEDIELELGDYDRLERKYPTIINKWVVEDES